MGQSMWQHEDERKRWWLSGGEAAALLSETTSSLTALEKTVSNRHLALADRRAMGVQNVETASRLPLHGRKKQTNYQKTTARSRPV